MKRKNPNPTFKNRRAHYDYELLDRLECGVVLVGTEVKSLRDGKCSLDGAWVKIEDSELWLVGCDIPEYTQGTHVNHVPKRDRKLLVHRREVDKFAKKSLQKGFTLIPTSVYFKNGWAKVEIAVARGKQSFDKRETIKERDAKRQMKH
jgi:SsrA-binding protein